MRDVIKTERLVLRPLELADAPAFSKNLKSCICATKNGAA